MHNEEEIEVVKPEDNSSEPSGSTGARQPARPLGGAVSGYEQDPGDTDSVVPTTPKLPLPRRNDGFAEAVSSPQVFQNYFFDMRRLWARLSICGQLCSMYQYSILYSVLSRFQVVKTDLSLVPDNQAELQT